MGSRGFISALVNAVAREIEIERRRKERERIKKEKQRYTEKRLEETEKRNAELGKRLETLRTLLEHALSIDDTICFESLRIKEGFIPISVPHELIILQPPPQKRDFLSRVKAPGLLEKALGLKKRYERELTNAESQYAAAQVAHEQARQSFMMKVKQRNQEVDELERGYLEGEPSQIITYNTMVLARSKYPDGFPQTFRLVYTSETKELVIDYDLPNIGIIPMIEYRYTKTRDLIEAKPRKAGDIKDLYQDVVSAVVLRTLHEVFEADQGNHLDVVFFNGFVRSDNPATERNMPLCLVSVGATREAFAAVDLARVDKRACLRSLGLNGQHTASYAARGIGGLQPLQISDGLMRGNWKIIFEQISLERSRLSLKVEQERFSRER